MGEKRLQIFKDERKDCLQRLEKRLRIKTANETLSKTLKIYSFSVLGAGNAPVDLTALSSLRACWTLKTVVKCKSLTGTSDPFLTSCVLDVQNCGKMQILDRNKRPFPHFVRVGRAKLW